jgi:cyclopropane-fatty-acyl-phospholipid synthase
LEVDFIKVSILGFYLGNFTSRFFSLQMFIKCLISLRLMTSPRKIVKKLLASADVEINGSKPWDVQVHNKNLYRRVLSQGSLGMGESYMDGWWDCEKLDEFFARIFKARLHNKIKSLPFALLLLKSRLFNRQSGSKAFEVGENHYDLGNDLFELMLDPRMVYSCAYWKNARNLAEAQEAKLELICRKLHLKPGMSVLDIGCGWGSWAKYAAEKYKVKVIGITVSKEQAKYAKKNVAGLPVEIRLKDYRTVNDPVDAVMSLAMFEAVGYKNFELFMKIVKRCLKEDGLFLLHTIGNTKSVYASDHWFDKYIFPNGMVPSIEQIDKSIRDHFIMEDWHNFGADYDPTLLAWYGNFNKNWGKLRGKYGERFRRMWNFYLTCMAGAFRSRYSQLWQIVFSKNGVQGGYKSVR